MIAGTLRNYLDQRQVRYVSIAHSAAYTAQQVAQNARVKGRYLVKTVIIRAGPETLMAVLPSTHNIEFERLARALNHPDVRLATEEEFRGSFPDCEPGAMPPFGRLYGMRVLCDTSLASDEYIVFDAGTHREAVRLAWRDFLTLVRPSVASFAVPR